MMEIDATVIEAFHTECVKGTVEHAGGMCGCDACEKSRIMDALTELYNAVPSYMKGAVGDIVSLEIDLQEYCDK